MAVNKNNVKIHVSHLKKALESWRFCRTSPRISTRGEVVVIIGPSGSGKSHVSSLHEPSEEITDGQIVVDGHDISDKKVTSTKSGKTSGWCSSILILFNNPQRGEEPDAGSGGSQKATKEEARKQAEKMLDKVGLLDKIENYPHSSPADRSSELPLHGPCA